MNTKLMLIIPLSIAILLCGCQNNINTDFDDPVESPIADPETPDSVDDGYEESVLEQSDQENCYEEMPEPFASQKEAGGDRNREFYSVVNMKLNYLDSRFCDFVGWDNVEEWLNMRSSRYGDYTAVDEVANLYSLIKYFNIPDETVREFLVDMRMGREDDFTDEEIDLLLSDNTEAIAEYFAHENAIRKGENLYSLYWVYMHPISDYIANGITPEDIQSKMPYFDKFGVQPAAKTALENKINSFISNQQPS